MGVAADRVVRILALLVEAQQPLSVTEVARRQRIDKSTSSRLLHALERNGLVERDGPRGKFVLGYKVLEFARAVLDRIEIRQVARPLLERLRDQTSEGVHLAVFRSGQAIYIDKVEGPGFIRTRTEVGDHAPLHCAATGKAILAWLPEAEVNRWMRGQTLTAYTRRTLTTARDLLPHLQTIRAQGYAVDDEEHVIGVRCVAAPIFNHAHQVIGSVGISGLAARLNGVRLREVTSAVVKTAHAISQRPEIGLSD